MDPQGEELKPHIASISLFNPSDVRSFTSFKDLHQSLNVEPFDNGSVAKIEENAALDDPTDLRSIAHARAEIARLAFLSFVSCDNFSQPLSPDTLSTIATYANLIGFEGYTKEDALKDYLAGLQVEATADLIGIDRWGERISNTLTDSRKKDLPSFYAQLSHYVEGFRETAAINNAFIHQIVETAITSDTMRVVQGMQNDLSGLLAPGSHSEEEIMNVANLLAVSAAQTVRPIWALIDDYSDIARGLSSSEILAYLARPDNAQMVEIIKDHPRPIYHKEELTPDRLDRLKLEVANYVEALPQLKVFADGFSQAIEADARSVSQLVDRKSEENDFDYQSRIQGLLATATESPEEIEIADFLSHADLDLTEDPLPLLQEISRIMKCDLKQATIATPHTYALENLVSKLREDLTDVNRASSSPDGGETTWQVAGEGGKQIQYAASGEKHVQKRVLIQVDGSDDVAEYNYTTGEWKSSGVVQDGWPNVNILTKDQYDLFTKLMRRISNRNL